MIDYKYIAYNLSFMYILIHVHVYLCFSFFTDWSGAVIGSRTDSMQIQLDNPPPTPHVYYIYESFLERVVFDLKKK